MSQKYYLESITHHGVKGQRWGVRRYQNEDGSLKNRGKQTKELTSEQKAEKQTKAKKIARIIGISSGVAIGTAGLAATAIAGKNFIQNLTATALIKMFDPLDLLDSADVFNTISKR